MMSQRKAAMALRQSSGRHILMKKLTASVLGVALPAITVLFTCGSARLGEDEERVIHLFNGKDLANFYTYLGAPAKGEKAYGKNHDPERVFTVHDGAVHVSGKVFGGFITQKEYENYH